MSTTLAPAAPHPTPSPVRVLQVELADEMRAISREPAALFFSILMPIAFFVLFATLFASDPTTGAVPVGTAMLATFGAYGVIGAVTSNPGIGLAVARDRGWLDMVRVSPTPVPVTLAAKVLAAVPFSVGILAAMTGTAAALGSLDISITEWLWVVASLVIGSFPFALIGLSVGAVVSPGATTAIINALLMPMAIVGGLWFPLDTMPDWMATVGRCLPTHHLSAIASAPLDGGGLTGHIAYMIGFTLLTGAIAVAAYRRSAA